MSVSPKNSPAGEFFGGVDALRRVLVRAQKFAPRTIFCFRGFIKFLCYNLCMDPDQNKKSATDEAAADLPSEVMGGIVSPNPKAVRDFNPDVHQAEEPVAAPAASTMAVAHEPQVGATADNPLTKFDLERAQAQEKAKAEAAARAPKTASAEAEAPAPASAVASRPAAPAAVPSRPAQPLTTMPAAAPAVQPRPATPTQPATPAPTAPSQPVAATPVRPAAPAPQPAPPTQPAPVQMPPAQFPTQQAAPADHGDIILGGGDSPKKKFNPILIAGIAVGVILVVVIAVLGLMNLNKNSGGESAGPVDGASFTREETIAAWNKFFNYLYSGTEDTGVAPLPEEPLNIEGTDQMTDIAQSAFTLDQSIAPIGEDPVTYMTRAKELLEPLRTAIPNHFATAIDDFNSLSSSMDVLITISTINNISLEDLATEYYDLTIEMAGSATHEAIATEITEIVATNYASLNNPENSVLQSYYNAELTYTQMFLDAFGTSYLLPCLDEDNILDATCAIDGFIHYNPQFILPADIYLTQNDTVMNVHATAIAINRIINADYYTAAEANTEETSK